MGMDPTFNPVGLFGFRDWRTGDETEDTITMNNFIDYLRDKYPGWSAAQVKQFLADTVTKIDEVSHI